MGGHKATASLLTMIFVAVVVFTPLTFLGVQIFQESNEIFTSFSEVRSRGAAVVFLENQLLAAQEFFPILKNVPINIEQYLRGGASWFVGHIGAIFTGFAKLALSLFVFLMSLYYFLKDGDRFKSTIKIISPLADKDDEIIIQKLKRAVDSVLRGSLIVALAQGLLAAAGFLIFGIPSPVLWGSFATLAALVPGIGTAVVIVPAVAFLFVTGQVGSSIGLLIWGAMVVGLIDNFLRPQLIGRSVQIHPLLILVSVLGGLVFFGPVGFLLGPLTVSFLLALFDTYVYFMNKAAA